MKTILLLLFSVTIAKAQISVFGKVDHIVPDGIDTVGGITLTVSGSTAPYTYTWNPGAINTKDITNQAAGHYTVNITSASSQTYTNAYKIGYKVQWQKSPTTTFRNDSLTANFAYANAYSKNTLASGVDGWFEYVINSLPTNHHQIGFADSISPIVTPSDVDYGVYYEGVGQDLYAVQAGTGNVLIKSNTKIGDVVRVERVGNVIKYSVTGAATRTVSVSGVSSKVFKIKAHLQGANKFNDVGCSFTGFDNQTFANYIMTRPVIKHCSGYGSSDGSIREIPFYPFANTYSWTPGGATTNSVTSLGYGTNKVTVKDSLLNASSHYYTIGYKVKWTNLDLCSIVGDSLLSSAASNLRSSANSKNVLKAGENGWVEFPIEKVSGESYYIGLSDDLSPLNGVVSDIDYGVTFNSIDNRLYYLENNSSTFLYMNPTVGDRVRVERTGNTISYKINSATLVTYTVSGLSSKSFRIKASIQNADYIARVGCSFYDIDSTNLNGHVQIARTLVKHCSGSGINDGLVSIGPKLAGTYTYTWLPGGASTTSISALSNGTYTVTIKDSLANTSTYTNSIGYKAKWTNLNNCFFRNDTIKGTGPNNTYTGNAYSKNILSANTNGWIEFVLKAYPANATWLGFTDSTSTSVTTLTEMNYGIVIPAFSKTLTFYEGGSTGTAYAYMRIGDVIRIERSGNSILYKVNGVTVRTVTSGTISAKVMKAKVRLQYNNELVNVGCSFGKEYRPAITHVSCLGSTNGSVYSNVRNGPDTYTYVWQPGSGTNSYITGQGTGTYSVTISSASDGTVTLPYDIGYKTRWSNLSNTTVSNDTLKQTRGDHANSWSNGATSLNALPASANGWVEYVATSPLRNKVFGLLDTVISADNYTDIDFGIYLNANGSLYTSNNGTQTSLVTYVPGDLIRIQRSNDTILYKKNGTAVYTTTVSSTLLQKDWKVKAAIYEYGAAFENMGCSFVSFDTKEIAVQDVNCVSGQNGVATFNALGGATPYSFYWDGGSLTSSATYTNLSVGIHSVQAIDNNSCTATQNFTVTRCPNWTTVNGGLTLNSKGDVTKSSGADSWNDNLLATADTFRLADTAFWLSFNAFDTASVYMIGFRSLEEDTTTQVTNYKLFLENSSVTLLETDNDGFYNKREIAQLTGTKDLKIQLTTQGIEYYSAAPGSSSYELLYRSRLFANRPFIIESQLYKTGSKVNHIRVSGDGN